MSPGANDDDAYRSQLVAPGPNATADEKLAFYQRQVDLRKAQIQSDEALFKAFEEADLSSLQRHHDALAEIAKGSIERARSGAEAVRNAAAQSRLSTLQL
jgi:hypothetical protein